MEKVLLMHRENNNGIKTPGQQWKQGVVYQVGTWQIASGHLEQWN